MPLSQDLARCYRCLVQHPAATLNPVTSLCGCKHDYCEDCIRDEGLAEWLRFVGSRCTKSARAA